MHTQLRSSLLPSSSLQPGSNHLLFSSPQLEGHLHLSHHRYVSVCLPRYVWCLMCALCCLGDEYKVVTTPPFAESVSEGDVRWEKGELWEGEGLEEAGAEEVPLPCLMSLLHYRGNHISFPYPSQLLGILLRKMR